MSNLAGIKWVGSYLKRYPFKTLYTFIISAFEVFIFMYPIKITAQVITDSIAGVPLSEQGSVLIWLFVLSFFQALLFFSVSYINEILAHRTTTDITNDLFSILQKRSLTYHDQHNIGEIMARATGDTRIINIAFSPGVRIFIEIIAVWAVIFVAVFHLGLIIIIISLIALFIYIISTIHYSKSVLPLSKESRVRFGQLSQITLTTITGIHELKGFASENWAKKKFIEINNTLREIQVKEGIKGAWFYPSLFSLFYGLGILITGMLGLYFGKNWISFRELLVLSGYLLLLVGISSELDWAMFFIVRAIAASNRIKNIIDEQDPNQGIDIRGKINFVEKAEIEFQHVWFKYSLKEQSYEQDNKQYNKKSKEQSKNNKNKYIDVSSIKDYEADRQHWILRDISFKIKDQETIAIVGGPGSGKTTLTKLIQRLYLPTKGEILLGNRPIQDYTRDILRRTITNIEQDIFLFNRTIKENIAYGKPNATLDEIKYAAKLAQAHDFIEKMPEKYDSLIGEGGIKLSGGQAQRIAIARALLVGAPILIMDDGASALDAKTELEIQEAISNVLQTHTTIITTHRLAIIARADKILILDKGKLVGIGTHEELIRSNHYYRRLFEAHYELPPLIENR